MLTVEGKGEKEQQHVGLNFLRNGWICVKMGIGKLGKESEYGLVRLEKWPLVDL
jgi:hypothetical protein